MYRRICLSLRHRAVREQRDVAAQHSRGMPTIARDEQIAAGAREAGAVMGETGWVIADRRQAIGHAIGMAQEGDVILLAGKGHEGSIFYGTEKRRWDDRLAAREALEAAGWSHP